MLCSMCQHGVTSSVNGKPTGNVWTCVCGESNCRHISQCECRRIRGYKFAAGESRTLLVEQTDDDGDGAERKTPAGSRVKIERIEPANTENPYIVVCRDNGAWFFFSEAEIDEQTRPIEDFRPVAELLPIPE